MLLADTAVANQGLLWKYLRILFPNTEIHVNSRENSTLKKPTSNSYLELDVWIPQFALSFEFQDTYHYAPTWYYQQSLVSIQQDDSIKQAVVHQHHLSLIKVPCWWDGDIHSLIGTIKFQRPDLLLDRINYDPIPINPVLGFFASSDLPEVGELMLASFPNDATITSLVENKWWMGEKYDGIRCCWNGNRRVLYSRKGREITLAPIFNKLHPAKEFIDGELWFGRGQFSSIYALIKGEPESVSWHLLRMISFDVPSINFCEKEFEVRYSHLLLVVSAQHPFNVVATRTIRSSTLHQQIFVQNIIDDQGEGVILRLCGSLYHHGRSTSVLKLKSTQGDQEGMVVHVKNQYVRLKLANGKSISVPQQDVFVQGLKQGDVVTFSYESHARRAHPVRPKIERVRTDLLWLDVLTNAAKDKRYLTERHTSAGFSAQPLRHWTAKNMRLFLEAYAKNRKMDPLSPNTWYKISSTDISQTKGGRVVLDKFKGGYFRMLQRLFPEIGLDESAFNIRARWQDIRARRNFFERYAKENGFDPLLPHNWQSQPKEKIMATKGARSVVFHHNNSLARALSDLFGFGEMRIRSNKPIWDSSAYRRKVFEKYAREKGFDPLEAHNWYAQSRKSLLSFEGVRFAILYHKYSVSQALLDLFPDIGLQKEKLQRFQAFMNKPENRRKFFETYARSNNFDPLNPEAWYLQSSKQILSYKGARRAVFYHNNSLAQALLDLFPEIGLTAHKMPSFRPEWQLESGRRRFFQNYAEDNSFDYRVPENWYSLPKDALVNEKGAQRVLSFHGNNMSRALVELFPELSFDLSKFDNPHAKPVLHDPASRRRVFEKYAKENNFDPLSAESWYLHAKSRKLLTFKGIFGVIGHHHLRVSKALLDLFPGIGLEKSKL